ncbi:MAG: universal stress protein [Bifidobacteriaceae bacterium]|nr:universal stress protein [Bifidobacteriaceae bacterium]
MSRAPVIVVGVDGSDSSIKALDWAVAEAEVRDAALEIVCAYTVPRFGPSSVDSAYLDVGASALSEGAGAVLDAAVQRAKQHRSDVNGVLEVGDAAGVLVERSKAADLMVMGTRGRGGFAERLLGTVSTALPVHAHCPTVVVPSGGRDLANKPETSQEAMTVGKIVVGVDGSNASKLALARAVDEAIAWNAELVAFASMPIASGTSLFAWAPGQVDHTAVLAELEAEVGRMIEVELDGRTAPDGFRVQRHALEGTASALLVEFSSSVDLIVVGSRGRGGFSGLLLGSTSQAVLHHARCPVMVVPARCKDVNSGPAVASGA